MVRCHLEGRDMMGIIWESKKEDLDVKRLRFAEILACFLLPAFCLLAASFLGTAEGEAYEPEKGDILQEEEGEEPAEDNSAEASEDILLETTDTEEDKKRMDLGYFYVQPDKIYWIKDWEAGTDISERELMEEGRIVCQFEPLERDTEPDEDWCYGGVGVQGDMCTFGRSQGEEGTFFWEDFVWLKGFGLIEYRSGWGACRDMIYIMMK